MVNVWINKIENEEPTGQYAESLIFSLHNKNNKSNIKTNIEQFWRRFGEKEISTINEDLLIISLAVFAIDKRVSRKIFKDKWTREIEVCIPVLEYATWIRAKLDIENLLNFLTGDKWKVQFRQTKMRYRIDKKNGKYNIIKNKQFDGISMFSGGLDSFCGAIKLLKEGKRICFTGFREYGLLEKRQDELYKLIKNHYSEIDAQEIWFNGTPYAPQNIKGESIIIEPENTSRSRSLLFLSGGLAIASIVGNDVPVYIPENGFIGINVPLTPSRKGTCSTRTTHPYFIRSLNDILSKIGITNKVENFYAYKTKGEIVEEIKETQVFKEGAKKTISCSHPCHARYDGEKPPMNCGYCYPCIIRRASMSKIGINDDAYNKVEAISKKFINQYEKLASKGDDLKAVFFSLNRYIYHPEESYIKGLIMQTGKLTTEEVNKAYRVYIQSMEEIKAMVINEAHINGLELLEYIGIEEEK